MLVVSMLVLSMLVVSRVIAAVMVMGSGSDGRRRMGRAEK